MNFFRLFLSLYLSFAVFSTIGVSGKTAAFPLFEIRGEGAVSAGLGRCRLLAPDPGFSGLNNPARTGETGGFAVSGFTSRPYSVPDLLRYSLWAAYGWKRNGLGAGISLFGNELYREEKITIGAGLRSRSLSYGASLGYDRIVIEGLGHRSFLSLSLGLQFRPDAQGAWRIGAVLNDVVRAGDPLRTELRPEGVLAVSCSPPSSGTILLLEVGRSSRYPVRVSMGVEIELWDRLKVRMGTGKNPSLYSLGFGVRAACFLIDLGIEEHTVLGQTRSLSFTFLPGFNR